jgi:NAD(P)-dependent dehydrogenase (short-subunit alcohol dehydrogenase family)
MVAMSTEKPVIVITGASAGIGAAAARALTSMGWHVHGTGRSATKLATVMESCEAGSFTPHVADFAELRQVRELAARLGELPRIDVLANNAGGTWPKRETTVDGHELTNQANHLAPFLLTGLLRERLTGARVIASSSFGQHFGRVRADDLDWEQRRYLELRVYGTSKLNNAMFGAELQRRWGSDVLSTSFHPGVVRSEFGRDTWLTRNLYQGPTGHFLRSVEGGADTLVFLATAPREALVPGAYYVNRKVGHVSRQVRDLPLSAAVWEASATAVGL